MKVGDCNGYDGSKAYNLQGEKVDVECKKAENSVPKSVIESYSGFANTKGGYIFLGIDEDKKKYDPKDRFIIQGINNPEGNDSVILEGCTVDDIDPLTLQRYRQLFRVRNPEHVWNTWEDRMFLEALINLIIHSDYLVDAGTMRARDFPRFLMHGRNQAG